VASRAGEDREQQQDARPGQREQAREPHASLLARLRVPRQVKVHHGGGGERVQRRAHVRHGRGEDRRDHKAGDAVGHLLDDEQWKEAVRGAHSGEGAGGVEGIEPRTDQQEERELDEDDDA